MKNRRAARDRRLHYRLMGRIYKLLLSGEWRVRYAKIAGQAKTCTKLGVRMTTVGTVDEENGLIIVDFRDEVLATVVHECLHVLLADRFLPSEHDAEELEVQRLEALIMSRMSRVQATRLHLLVADALVR